MKRKSIKLQKNVILSVKQSLMRLMICRQRSPRLEAATATLTNSSDELAEQAEGSSKPMEFITQFNAVRGSVKEYSLRLCHLITSSKQR